MESGEAYKGACWCERAPLPAETVRRLEDETGGAQCLCAGCLDLLAAEPELPLAALRARRRDGLRG